MKLCSKSGRWSPTPIPRRAQPDDRRRDEETREKETKEMFNDLQYVALQDRTVREQDLAERVAERRNYARPAGQPSVRARMARRRRALAAAPERDAAARGRAGSWPGPSPPRGTRRGGWSGRGWRRGGACKTGAPPGGEGFERRF